MTPAKQTLTTVTSLGHSQHVFKRLPVCQFLGLLVLVSDISIVTMYFRFSLTNLKAGSAFGMSPTLLHVVDHDCLHVVDHDCLHVVDHDCLHVVDHDC